MEHGVWSTTRLSSVRTRHQWREHYAYVAWYPVYIIRHTLPHVYIYVYARKHGAWIVEYESWSTTRLSSVRTTHQWHEYHAYITWYQLYLILHTLPHIYLYMYMPVSIDHEARSTTRCTRITRQWNKYIVQHIMHAVYCKIHIQYTQ